MLPKEGEELYQVVDHCEQTTPLLSKSKRGAGDFQKIFVGNLTRKWARICPCYFFSTPSEFSLGLAFSAFLAASPMSTERSIFGKSARMNAFFRMPPTVVTK